MNLSQQLRPGCPALCPLNPHFRLRQQSAVSPLLHRHRPHTGAACNQLSFQTSSAACCQRTGSRQLPGGRCCDMLRSGARCPNLLSCIALSQCRLGVRQSDGKFMHMQSPFQQQRDQDALQNALANLPGAAVNAGSVLLVGLTAGAGLLVGGRSPGVTTNCVHQTSHSGSRPPGAGSGDERQASVSAQPHGVPSARRVGPFLAQRQARSSSSGCRRSGRRPPALSCTTCCAQRRIPAASPGRRCCSPSAHVKGLGPRNTQCWSMWQCHRSSSWTTCSCFSK